MKSIAISNNKGGVGKSTSSAHLAELLSLKGKTCLIDGDPQGNVSSWLITEKFDYELADVLSGSVAPGRALHQLKGNFYMLPTRPGGNLRNYGETKINDEPFVFCDLLEVLESLNFKYVVFDTSPALGRIERAILTAAAEVITPITPEYFSIQGIKNFIIELERMKKNLRLDIKHDKIIANNVNLSFNIHKAALSELDKTDYKVFVIPQDSQIKVAQEYNKSIFDYNPGARCIEYYNLLAGAY